MDTRTREELRWCRSWWTGPAAQALFDRWPTRREVLRAYRILRWWGVPPMMALWRSLQEWDLLTFCPLDQGGLRIPTTVGEALR